MFSANTVAGMDTATVGYLMREPDEVVRDRKNNAYRLEMLRSILETCNEYTVPCGKNNILSDTSSDADLRRRAELSSPFSMDEQDRQASNIEPPPVSPYVQTEAVTKASDNRKWEGLQVPATVLTPPRSPPSGSLSGRKDMSPSPSRLFRRRSSREERYARAKENLSTNDEFGGMETSDPEL